MKIRAAYTCPLEVVHDIIKGKWKPIIVFKLRDGGMSLAELERGIEGINQKMLLQHLKDLQAFDIIEKTTYEGYPLKVSYALTKDRGQTLLRAVYLMQLIGVDIMVEQGNTQFLEEKGIDYRFLLDKYKEQS